MEIGMISATLGLIIGGIFGGPTANFLIKRYKLKPSSNDSDNNITIGAKHGTNPKIDYNSILTVILALAISIGIGIYLHKLLELIHFTLPLFATCMFGGVLVVNIVPLIIPKLNYPVKSPTLAITSDLSLGLFLAMAMMSLKFWEIGNESLFIIINILAQTIAIILFTVFVLFKVLGKNYDAAVISAGYIGSAMGATPTAMANIAAVTKKNGPSEIALAVIPIMGAFIIQVSNAIVINIILKF
jgi:ESS family glutamate:Na+ symporter